MYLERKSFKPYKIQTLESKLKLSDDSYESSNK